MKRSFAFLFLFCALFLSSAVQADSLLDLLKPDTARTGQKHVLHGNTESKIYHAFDCEHYNCKTCTQTFTSQRQAESMGYRPCSLCKGQEGYASAMHSGKKAFHGNPQSKIVHGPSCKYYNAKGSTEHFTSLEAAKRQGYRVCTLCDGK
ncbi:MAG: hypothetical protein J5803_01245 [Desulfovibrio sp.]|nr:hypothetical protein [Desulfovibrio sp.]